MAFQQFGDGLDHIGTALDGLGHVRRHQAPDAVHHLLHGLADEAELNELPDVLPDLTQSPGDLCTVVVHETHVEPVLGEGLRDALAHRPRTHDQ